jgi:hypothetical protein
MVDSRADRDIGISSWKAGFVMNWSAFSGFGGGESSLVRGRHPPPGLAFGEPDDRLRRVIQYAAAVVIEARSR